MNDLAKPVLVDTSVWIAYLRREESAFTELNVLADAGRVRLLGLILAELYQGCKSQKELDVVSDLADIFPKLDEPSGMWEEAGTLAYKLRRQGITPGLADCYIAVIAAKSGSLIYTYDKHFEKLAPICILELHSPESA